MSRPGSVDLLVAARGALLDALEALSEHRSAVIVVGAQAIYLHTGAAPVALAEATKDSDLALDVRALEPEPLLEEAMRAAGFHLDLEARQPGAWLSIRGIPVDLMVPEALAGQSGRRGARIPPHAKDVARRAVGLEAAVVDYAPTGIRALDPVDARMYTANVAGPAALLVAKLHKLGERQATPGRLADKDAHDVYRLLVASPTDRLASKLVQLRTDDLAGPVTEQALAVLAQLFASGATAHGSAMAGRAEEGVGDPATVSAAAAALAEDLLTATQ
jgi:hypothetical protein